MASNEVEVLDPTATVERSPENTSEVARNRRYFMAALGLAGAAVGSALLSGPSAHAQQPTPTGFNQIDVLNFLLNIKYLKATLYSYIIQNADLPATSGVGTGTGGVFNGFTKFTFSSLTTAQINDLFNEMYYDELNQLIALRALLGSAAVPRQTVNLLGTGTTTTATLTPTLNQAIGIARMLEDVSVQAFAGASVYLTGTNLAYVSQVLAVNGFHAGALRLICIQNGIPYISSQGLTTNGTAQSVNSITGGLISGSPTIFMLVPTNPVVVGDAVSGVGVPEGTVISAVNPAVVYTGSIAGSTTTPTNTITSLNTTAGLVVGQSISGSGISANSTITAISGNTITINNANVTSTSPGTPTITTTANNVTLTVGFLAVAYKTSTSTVLNTVLYSVSSFAGLAVGQPITGTGIPTNTTITALNSAAGTVTMSAAATAASQVTPTGLVTNKSNVITQVSSVSGVTVGQPISGTGIPATPTTTITAVDPVALTITMSANATATSFASPTGILTTGSNVITSVSSVSGLAIGQAISGVTGLPSGATIAGFNSSPVNTITLSANATANATGTTPVTLQGILSSGSAVITGIQTKPSAAVGQPISGATIPAGATVTAIPSSTATAPFTITISAPATADALGTTTATPTATVSNGSPYLTAVSGLTGVAVNQWVSGANIPAGAYIKAIDSTQKIITMSVNASGAGTASVTVSNAPVITFITKPPTFTVANAPETLTIPSLQTVTPGLGTLTMSQNATTTGGVTLAQVTADSQDVEPNDPGTAAGAAAGPSAVANSSPTVYQGFFDTAGTGTASASTPAGFAFARTFSQVLAVLYGNTTTGATQGGFFPNGVSGTINIV